MLSAWSVGQGVNRGLGVGYARWPKASADAFAVRLTLVVALALIVALPRYAIPRRPTARDHAMARARDRQDERRDLPPPGRRGGIGDGPTAKLSSGLS